MATTNPEQVKFNRGGHEISLYKSPTELAVKLKNNELNQHAFERVFSQIGIQQQLRWRSNKLSQRSAVFKCKEGELDEVMQRIRQSDEIQFCSHIFQRTKENGIVWNDIALDNRIFLELKSDKDRQQIKAIEEEYGLRTIFNFPENNHLYVLELTDRAKINPLKISNGINKMAGIFSEPCLIEEKFAKAIPSVSGFKYQWHLLNTGQGNGIPGADCNAVQAWDYTFGNESVILAVIDDGFDLAHPDFKGDGKIVKPYDAMQRDYDPSPEFHDNHGTCCAGVALASRFYGQSMGIASDCKLMPIRHSGELGDFEEALAFYHAFKNNASIISCSWGPYDAYLKELWPMATLTQRLIDICAEHGRDGKGIPIFFAAGNGNEPLNLDGYADYKNVIAVAACTNKDEKAYYSDYGDNVWVTAPSNGGTLGIFTTDRMGKYGYNDVSDYTFDFGGTSSATPLVAGVASLILSANNSLTRQEIKSILKETAVKINKDNPREYTDYWGNKYNDKYNADGHSQVFGWGKVNAGAAVEKAHLLNQ